MGRLRNRSADLPNEGPDWADVSSYIRVIEDTHKATLTVSLFTDGRNYAGTLFVRIRASVPTLTGPGMPYHTEMYARWPDTRHKTMEGLILALLYQVDHKIGSEAYQQRELPF
jgi:hypothetical protein